MDRDKELKEENGSVDAGSDVNSSQGASTIETINKGMTRIYDAKKRETQTASTHRWIDDNDEPVIKPIDHIDERATRVVETRDFPVFIDRRTRVGRDSNTRLYRGIESSMPDDGTGEEYGGRDKESSGSFGEGVKSAASGVKNAASEVRGTVGALRNVKVADRKKFSRFLKIIGVFAVILLLELAWLRFAVYVKDMPQQIKKAQKELELTQKENKLLEKEIEVLGDPDSAEELKESWERLKEKVENAAAETS